MLSRLRLLLEAERDRFILFAPVWLGLGALAYFRLAQEPPWWLGTALLAVSCLCFFPARRQAVLRIMVLATTMLALGFACAQWRVMQITPSILTEPMAFATVQGTLEAIEQTPKGSKIILNDVTIDHLPPEKTPKRISLTLRAYDATLSAGQHLSLRAGLFPPPEPALPGGFDFARHYYFREIGAVGYGIPPVTVLPATSQPTLADRFADARHLLTDAIRRHFSEPAGSVAAAFITGQTQTIPAPVNDMMRTVGLYHLLAVSGMNLSVVAGIAFFTLRLLLAAIPALSLRYPIKKWAAVAALIMSYIYLEVAGSPVSAQRAFLMVSFIFIAILLDRDPAPMRSVAASAFLILLVSPEAVLSASFQLSYSATAALIASYEWGVARLPRQSTGFGFARIGFYFAAVVGTSFVAWMGTEPFIIHHFNQFSSYSLLANTIAEPLVSFLLMPLVLAGVLLMPLGLGALAFAPMQYGVDALLALARWVESLPHALWIIPSPTDAGFALTAGGLVWLYIWKTSWRWLGLAAYAAGLATAMQYTPPDILVSDDGKHIAARLEDGSAAMLKGRKDSFIASQWSHAFVEHALQDKKAGPLHCDKSGCILPLRGHRIALPKAPEALADDCTLADIVIATDFAVTGEQCPAPIIIDKQLLETGGAASVYLKDEPFLTHARSPYMQRPWTSHAQAGE